MANEAEALLALSEKCPAPVKAVGRSLVVQQSEHRRFESYLGSPEMAQFLEALVNAYRSGSLIHRSALAEDTARAAEGWEPIETAPKDGTNFLAAHEASGVLQITWFGKTSHVPLYGWAICPDGDGEEIDLWSPTHWRPLPAPPALPLTKETADANR